MLRIETGLVLLSLLVAFIYPTLGASWFEKLEERFSQLSRSRVLSVVLVGLTALGLRAALLPIEPIPEPIVHDEFGYLLAADTFAHGRLTNPTHPMWEHFETFSILQKPTYQCFAQPAQGMILALGKVFFGHPFWGLWLSIGLMCSAITWMLQGWLPPEWALLGGVLAILRYGSFGYWANSYWGGAAGAIGGALVLGALPRIKESQRVRDALLMGLGLAILANSRPYEGLVFSLPVAIALGAWMLGKNRPSFRISRRRLILPLALTLAIATTGMGYYFWRVTGSPFQMPYQIERAQYAVAPFFAWQSIRPQPYYRHAVIKKMYVDEELVGYQVFHSPAGLIMKAWWGWKFYAGPLFTLPFLMMIAVLPYGFSWNQLSGEVRLLIITLALLITALLVSSFYWPHYSSPATAIILALVLSATRRVSEWRFGRRASGVFLTRAILVIAVVMFLLRAGAHPLHLPLDNGICPAWNEEGPRSFGRSLVDSQLLQLPGKQLVIVRYKTAHEPFEEWVYNEADIDNSKVVWAREMDQAQDEELVRYFKDRQVLLLEADDKPPKLTPYGTHASADPIR